MSRNCLFFVLRSEKSHFGRAWIPVILFVAISTAVGLGSPASAFAAKRKAPASSAKAESVDASSNSPQWLPAFTKTLKASGFKPSELGLWISKGSRADEAVFEQNANSKFIPASLSKIPTAGAILSLLPPSVKFQTILAAEKSAGVRANGVVEGGVLKGPLYLVGGGDPAFVSENLWFLVNEALRSQIRVIEGDLIVDDSRFDGVRFDQDREDRRVDRAYDAPIGALSLNWNSVTAWVRPGVTTGVPALVSIDVASPYVTLQNKTKTTANGNSIAVERLSGISSSGPGAFETIVASGSIAEAGAEKAYYKNIREPALWVGNATTEFFKQRGIEFKGKVRVGKCPDSAITIAASPSKPLVAIVTDMMKWSNNFVAEMLVKNLAAESGEKPATMATGLRRVRSWLESSVGLKPGDYEYINAAGFTRSNQFTPRQMGRVLTTIRRDFRIFPEFLSALPVGGVDGTLRNRMKRQPGSAASSSSEATYRIRAKTGLLNGVVGLSGFIGDASGRMHSFVFIYNGKAGREETARALFDKLALIVAGGMTDGADLEEADDKTGDTKFDDSAGSRPQE